MSVEDLTLDCQSDQEDQSAEKKGRGPHLAEVAADDIVDGAVGTGGHDDVLYLELFLLFHNLKSFECIYDNNALIDQEVRASVCRGVSTGPLPASHQRLNDAVLVCL